MEEDPRLVATALEVLHHWREEAERKSKRQSSEEDQNDGVQYSG